MEIRQKLVRIGEGHAPLTGKRTVEINLFKIQFPAEHVQQPAILLRCLRLCLGQDRFVHDTLINEDLLDVTVEVDPAQGAHTLELGTLFFEHGQARDGSRSPFKTHQAPPLTNQVRQGSLVPDKRGTQNEITEWIRLGRLFRTGNNDIHIVHTQADKPLSGSLGDNGIPLHVQDPMGEPGQHSGKIA